MPGVALVALIGLMAPFVVAQSAAADDDDQLAPVVINFDKVAVPAAPTAAIPGGVVSYQFYIACSGLTAAGCVNMTLTDSIPAPLVLQSVSMATQTPPIDIETNGNDFTVRVIDDLGGGLVGLRDGGGIQINATATVPSDLSADFNGQILTNTAVVTVSNQEDLSGPQPRPNRLESSAEVALAVTQVLGSSTTKSITPEATSAIQGREVAFTLGATNTSNAAVDELVIQEPSSTSSTVLDYIGITGFSGLSLPAGADRVRIDWTTNGTDWLEGTAAPTASLPVGVDTADIRGLRIVFSATSGRIERGAVAAITIDGALTAAAAAISSPLTVTNTVTSWVRRDATTTNPEPASDTIRLDPTSVAPIATKQFADPYVIGGQLERVTIGGQNGGDFALREMTITEPAPGTTSLADQGLTFDSWVTADIEWPVGATSAEVSYWYEGESGFSAPVTTTTVDTIPDPTDAALVQSIRVRFLSTLPGGMTPGQFAVLPFIVVTDAVVSDITTVNEVRVDVVTLDDQTGTATATDDLTRRTSRVNTEVSKTVNPSTLYGIAGAQLLVSLPARVTGLPVTTVAPTASTVGSESLVISDPVDVGSDEFWNYFDLTSIVATAVPANTRLTVQYYDTDTQTWEVLPAADGLLGPTLLSTTIPSGLRDVIGGVRFTYEHRDFESAGTLLNPGFNVQPNLRFAVRADLRDGTGEAASATRTESVLVDNTVLSVVTNPSAIPDTATDDALAGITLLPTNDGSGDPTGNISAISKAWQPVPSTTFEAVNARSAEQATAQIRWGTAGIGFDSVVITDTASDPVNVADTVFEAFDLVRVPAITSGMDPLLTFDRIVAIELYLPGSGWERASGDPCPAACDGTFPGYTLTPSEKSAATAVRLIIEESPTRSSRIGSSPAAPAVGSGVASSMSLDRRLDLVFEVRDVRRSNPSIAVLGSTRETLYNTSEFGEVRNTVRLEGRDVDDAVQLTRTAADDILILDQPLTVEVTKSWVDGPLGTPPAGTPQALYPRARMTVVAENASVSRIDQLSIVDPVASTNPFEAVNVYDIVEISVPSGATSTSVVLIRESGPDVMTRAAALALTPSQLENVVGIEIHHTGRIDVQATARLVIDTQLRQYLRSTLDTRVDHVTRPLVTNTAQATITDPGGLGAFGDGEQADTLVAQASAQVRVETLDYGVTATKGIQANTSATPTSPAIQWEGSSRTATITLTGQPSGNVRSTDMVIEDMTPSFWNAYNFSSLSAHSFAQPLDRVKVGVLLGVTYELDAGQLVARCAGSAVLDACWHDDTDFRSTLALPTLPAGATTADIRGIRFHYARSDRAAWERPFNPLQTVRFTVSRRDLLVEPSTQPVPSTLYIYDEPAPGETVVGDFTNTATVTAWADNSPNVPLWEADDSDTKQIRFQHRPAEVRVVKTPWGSLSLGAPIPYEIAITNIGAGDDKDLTGLHIVDMIPVDGPSNQPMLVLGTDPDTGASYTPEQIISLTLTTTAGQTVAPPTFTATLGANGPTGQPLTITIDPAFVLPKGWTLTVAAPMFFRPFFEAGSEDLNFALNSAIVTSDQEFDRCEYGTDGALVPEAQEFVASCTSTTKVWALPSAPMNITKGVKGVEAGPLDEFGVPLVDDVTNRPFDDLGVIRTINNDVNCGTPSLTVDGAGYYRHPCVPITRPGGTEEWVANFFNAGNVRVFEVVAIDVLPRQNDRGVIINEARSSRWAPILTTRPELVGWPDEAMTVYYTDRLDLASVACNGADIQWELGMTADTNPAMIPAYQPCITSSAPGGLPDRANPTTGWQVMPALPSDELLESVIALKFVIDLTVGVTPENQGLLPGEEIAIRYRSETAREPVLRETNANLARDSIAYNSIAGAARGRDGDNDLPYRFVTEPRKVGVALATGALDLAKVVDGDGATFAPSTFRIAVDCSVDGQPISLLDSTGANRSPFTIAGNAADVRVLGIPLYAECDISEVGTTGATTTTIVPETVTARALGSSPSVVFNPRPAFDDRDDIERSVVTNTYELASLTVSKSVNMNGALNAAGGPVMQTNFTFTVACTYNTGSGPTPVTLAPADASFTLNNEGVKTIRNLPAGAVCTVTETETRGATVTKVITTGGTSSQPSAPVAVVTLSPDTELGEVTNTVAYTNSIPVASLTVNKLITGEGAAQYGTGTFTILVSCTRASAVTDRPTGAPTNSVWYGTFTLSAATGLTRTIENIPAGSSCSVTEPVGGRAGATQVTTQGAITLSATAANTRSVTNRFALASLEVGKTVLTDAVDAEGLPVYPTDPFAFEVECLFEGATVLATGFTESPMTFELRHGETPRRLAGLPAGASCTVTETDDQDADSTSITRTVNTSSTLVDGPSTTFAPLAEDVAGAARNVAQFINRYGVTSFTISKEVIGGGGAQFAPETFIANLVCTSPLVGESFNNDVEVPANGFVTIENLADGSTCTVFERNPLATADAHRIVDENGDVIDGTNILATATNPASVTLENYYLTGELHVSKSVIGAGAAYGSGPFEVTLSCVRDGIAVDIDGGATRQLLPDGTVTYSLLPSRSQCTLTETNAAGATSSRIVDENGDELTDNVGTGHSFPIVINANELVDNQVQNPLEVENTFELASIAITKTVSSEAVDQNGEPIEYGPFPVSVACTFQDGDVFGAGYDADAPMQRDLADGVTWNLTGLPNGAECTVTETSTMNAAVTRVITAVDSGDPVTRLGATATVIVGTVTTAEIENDYTVGSLQVSKAVIGAGAGDWADASFEIDVTCVLSDLTGVRTVFSDTFTFLRGDVPVLIEDVATGALCTITETATGGASSTRITIDGDTVDGTVADVTIADERVDATVTNLFGIGEIRVEKRIEGDGAAIWGAGPFEVELSCVRDIDGVEQAIEVPGGATRELTLDGFYRATYDELPIDAVCSLAETRAAGATSTLIDVSEVTVAATPVTFTVTNTFDVGSVAVEKTFAGDGTGLFVRGSFEASIACTLDIDGESTELAIPGGSTRELTPENGYRNGWDQLPAGADCTVTESRSGGATSTTITDGEFTVDADAEHLVSIENSFLLAAFSVTKSLTGPFAFEAANSVFVIETSCLWDRDGELVPMLPGDWWTNGDTGGDGGTSDGGAETPTDPDPREPDTSVRSQIWDGATVWFENLPAGAVCTVTEVDAGGATGHLLWMDNVLQLGDLALSDGDNDALLTNVFLVTLALTGVEIVGLLWLIAALLFAGIVLLTIARRRAAAER